MSAPVTSSGQDGRGNYWSDNSAFDLDSDGSADQIYKPNDLVDQIVWRHPLAKLLLNSPSMQLLKWVQAEFPTLHPGGVTDSKPLMSPAAPRPSLSDGRVDIARLAGLNE
jgi:nitrous oxidase accessory protein